MLSVLRYSVCVAEAWRVETAGTAFVPGLS